MRILWLHSHLLYSNGGTRFIYEVASRLNKYHKLTICVEKGNEEWINKFKSCGIAVQTLSSYTSTSLLYWLFFPLFLIKEKLQLKKLIESHDLVISSMFPFNFLALQKSRPTIYYCFEPFAFFYDTTLISDLSFFRRFGSILMRQIYQCLDKKAVRETTKVLTINHTISAWIKRIYKRKPDNVTYLGVDTDFFYKRDVPKPIHWRNRLILLHNTDFTVLKGTEYLIRALTNIIKEFPKVKLLITQTINNAQEKHRYELLIHSLNLDNYIEFIGYIPYLSLPKYYSFADIVCFTADPTSIGTTASLSVLEAMACEVPVVRSVGCEEEIIHGESGFLADPRKTKEYAEMVLRLLKYRYVSKRMSKTARKRFLKYYQWDKVVNIFLSEIQRFDL